MSKINFMIPRDAGGEAPDGTIWTGEIQAISYTNTSTAATQVTVPGPALMECMKATRPGIIEYELDAVGKYV